MKTLLVTGSTGSPLTLEEIKDHLRIERGETIDDDLLKGLRTAAVEYVENVTNRKLMSQDWKYYLDEWPDEDYIELPYPPLQSVSSSAANFGIYYTDSTSGSTTFGSSAWSYDTVSIPGRVVLENSESWPTEILHNKNPIEVRFTCGYAATSDIPRSIKQAMLLIIGHWFEQREDTLTGQELRQVPKASDALLAPYRHRTF